MHSGRDARFHTTPCRGHTHADVDQHFALMQSMQDDIHAGSMARVHALCRIHAGSMQDDARTGFWRRPAWPTHTLPAAAAAMLPDAPALTRPHTYRSSLPACTTWSMARPARTCTACSSHTMQHATDDESSSDNGMPTLVTPTNSDDEVGHEDEDEDAD